MYKQNYHIFPKFFKIILNRILRKKNEILYRTRLKRPSGFSAKTVVSYVRRKTVFAENPLGRFFGYSRLSTGAFSVLKIGLPSPSFDVRIFGYFSNWIHLLRLTLCVLWTGLTLEICCLTLGGANGFRDTGHVVQSFSAR